MTRHERLSLRKDRSPYRYGPMVSSINRGVNRSIGSSGRKALRVLGALFSLGEKLLSIIPLGEPILSKAEAQRTRGFFAA